MATTTWGIVRDSARVLRREPSLLAIPALAFLTSLVSLALWVALLALGAALARTPLAMLAAIVLFMVGMLTTVAFVIMLAKATIVACAQRVIRGEAPSLGQGFALAWSRRGALLKWAFANVVIGIAIGGARKLIGSSSSAALRFFADAIGIVAGLTWEIATFFVIPVILETGAGPKDAVVMSAKRIRAMPSGAKLEANLFVVGLALVVVPYAAMWVLATLGMLLHVPTPIVLVGTGASLVALVLAVGALVPTLHAIFVAEMAGASAAAKPVPRAANR